MNVERLLGSLLTGGMGSTRRSSSLLGGMGIGKAQVGVGLLGVAFAAYEHYQQSQRQSAAAAPPPLPLSQGPSSALPPPPPPPMAAPAPQAPAVETVDEQSQGDLMLVLEVMIAAAHADGRIDAQERATILQKAMQLELSSDERHHLMRALDQPASAAELAARARPGIAPDLYAAALLAITIDTEQERQWLAEWGKLLALSESECRQLEAQFAEAAA